MTHQIPNPKRYALVILCALFCISVCNAATPPIPAVRDIKRDLVGRTLSTATEQLRNSFKIESQSDIRTIAVKDTQRNDIGLRYTVALKLDNDINQFNAQVWVFYKLTKDNQWKISHIETRELKVIPSGQFKSCISVHTERKMYVDYLFFHNSCDVALVVEGVIYAWKSTGERREWQKFAIDVPANGKAEFHYETNVDYKITRIERP
jgi:hypothetical protein